mmetsp:Transcript_46800/g.100221  ORF Transcript_46800/g.100221 Transcript_46800/m.100221 type:complete len:360 (-) Transcript_46800:141-1220(-)
MSSAVEATASTSLEPKGREVSFEGSESTRSSVMGRCESPATVDLSSELDWTLHERVATSCLDDSDEETCAASVSKAYKSPFPRDPLTLRLDQILGLSSDAAVRADKQDGGEQSGCSSGDPNSNFQQTPNQIRTPNPQNFPSFPQGFALNLDLHLNLDKPTDAENNGSGGDVTPTKKESAKEQLQEMMGSLMRKLGSDRLNAVLATTTTSTTATSSPTTAVATPMVPTLSPSPQGESSLWPLLPMNPLASIAPFPSDVAVGQFIGEGEGELMEEYQAVLDALEMFRSCCEPDKLPDIECYGTITVTPSIAAGLGTEKTAEEESEVKAFGSVPVKVVLPWYPMVNAGPRDCTMPLKVQQWP